MRWRNTLENRGAEARDIPSFITFLSSIFLTGTSNVVGCHVH
jgi:hypothetical protein